MFCYAWRFFVKFVNIFLALASDWVACHNVILLNILFSGCQISGEASVVKKALCQIASRLHDNPSRSQHSLASAISNSHSSSGSLVGPTAAAPIVGIAPLMGPYGGYKGDTAGDWSRSLYSAPRDDLSSKEFSLRLVCPVANIGGVIGKGGAIINQIRQESGAAIKVDSSSTEGDDCLITVSSKEVNIFSFVVCFYAWLIMEGLGVYSSKHIQIWGRFSFLRTHYLQL